MPSFFLLRAVETREIFAKISHFVIESRRAERKDYHQKDEGCGWLQLAEMILQIIYQKITGICGKHFISGRAAKLWDKFNPDWVPSLQLGHDKLARQTENSHFTLPSRFSAY